MDRIASVFEYLQVDLRPCFRQRDAGVHGTLVAVAMARDPQDRVKEEKGCVAWLIQLRNLVSEID